MTTAVLLLAHGTPESVDQVPEYLRNITGGRELPASVVEEVKHRYALIGHSPLTEITERQGELLSEVLQMPVYVGMRNWHPYIADTMKKMRNDGAQRVIAICLAPQNSRTSVGLYRNAVISQSAGMHIEFVESWHDHPLLIAAFAERLAARVERDDALVIFTAHSVPCRTIAAGDPYGEQARETAILVAAKLGLTESRWFFAFQSQGMSGGPWIGPTVEDTLRHLSEQGCKRVVVQPIGFLCDHVEILYDIDIGFREHARGLNMEVARPESLNDSSLLVRALGALVRSRASVHESVQAMAQ
jgi:ferrochelatase